MTNVKRLNVEYRGYTITVDGPGFYRITDPAGNGIGTCEGMGVAQGMVNDRIHKVHGWYARTSNLSPTQARAAAYLSHDQAIGILAAHEDNVADLL